MKKITPRNLPSLFRAFSLVCYVCSAFSRAARRLMAHSAGRKSLAQGPGNTSGNFVRVGASYHNDVSHRCARCQPGTSPIETRS